MKKLITAILAFAALGLLAETPSARIDIWGNNPNEKVGFKDYRVDVGKGVVDIYAWDKENGKYALYSLLELPPDTWTQVGFTFTPIVDGTITVLLTGVDKQAEDKKGPVPVFTFYDSIELTGAEIKNGNFEELDEKGNPKQWLKSASANPATDAILVKEPKFVKNGSNSVRVWCQQPFSQIVKVKANVPVLLRVWAYCPSK